MTLIIDHISGNCPVQGEGTIDGEPFYFRARWLSWSMGIGGDPVGIPGDPAGEPLWFRQERWTEKKGEAGWMPVEEARRIIEKCAAEFMRLRRTSREDKEHE